MRFKMDDWTISPHWEAANEAALNGHSFLETIQAAMRRLIDSFGTSLEHEARTLMEANPPSDGYQFDASHLRWYLKLGNFQYNQVEPLPPHPLPGTILISTSTPQLVVCSTPPGAEEIARTQKANRNEVQINISHFSNILSWSSEIFTDNRVGEVRLEVLIGKIMLHEEHAQSWIQPSGTPPRNSIQSQAGVLANASADI